MTRIYALLILLAIIGLGVTWFVSQMGGESFLQVLKDGLAILWHIAIVFSVIGFVAYILDVLISGSWTWGH